MKLNWLILIGFFLVVLTEGKLFADIPWGEAVNGVQVSLSYESTPFTGRVPGIVVRIKNNTAKVFTVIMTVRCASKDGYDIAARGEGTFQLFLIKNSNERTPLNVYTPSAYAMENRNFELPYTLKPGVVTEEQYRVPQGTDDLKRMANNKLVAFVRLIEHDPRESDDPKNPSPRFNVWSNVVQMLAGN